MQRIVFSAFAYLIFFAPLSQAAGLRVPIDNGLGVPGAASGPALAEDASTGVTNPAGLVRIHHPELVVGVNPAFTSTEFKGTVTVAPDPNAVTVKTGSANAKLNVPLIGLHFSYPLTDWLVYGFGLTNPFGQSVHYGDDSIVASTVTEGMLITWDISNSFAFRVTDDFSIGAGIDAIRLDFDAENLYPISVSNTEIFSVFTHNSASGWSMSWHAGFLYQFNHHHSRIGFNYRPHVSMQGEGKSFANMNTDITIPPVDPIDISPVENRDFKIKFDLPPIYSLAIYHQIMPHLDVSASMEYTQWDYFDKITFENVVNAGDFEVAEGYHNTFGYGAAIFYQWTQKFRTSAGVKFDYSPVSDKYVNVDFPDSDVWVVGVSSAYQFNKVVRLEVGYSHSFFQEVDINHYDPVSFVRNQGTGHLYGDIINTQLTMNLAPVVKAFDDFNEEWGVR